MIQSVRNEELVIIKKSILLWEPTVPSQNLLVHNYRRVLLRTFGSQVREEVPHSLNQKVTQILTQPPPVLNKFAAKIKEKKSLWKTANKIMMALIKMKALKQPMTILMICRMPKKQTAG